MRIKESKILITGASSGIGAALAPLLAKRGATVGIVARRQNRLEEVLEQCREYSPDSRLWQGDLSDRDQAQSIALDAWKHFGGLDCLINNAAIPKRTPVDRLTPADIDSVMKINFASPIDMTLALLPHWLARKSGCIVNVASLGGRIGIVHEAAYCASKFALCGWSESLAIDLAGTGVEVKLILPGPIETEIWDLPDNDAAIYSGPLVPASDCAASIATALETDGFEFFAPPEFPGGGNQRDIVVGKTNNIDQFISTIGTMAITAREKETGVASSS